MNQQSVLFDDSDDERDDFIMVDQQDEGSKPGKSTDTAASNGNALSSTIDTRKEQTAVISDCQAALQSIRSSQSNEAIAGLCWLLQQASEKKTVAYSNEEVCRSILDCISLHVQDGDVQLYGLKAMQCVHELTGSVFTPKVTASAMGRAVLDSIEQHPDCVDIEREGLVCLSHFRFVHDMSEEACRWITQQMLQSMSTPSESRVQGLCGCLCDIVCATKNEVALSTVAANGIVPLLMFFGNFAENVDLCLFSIKILSHLASKRQEFRTKILESGGINTIKALQEHHIENVFVQQFLFRLYSNLALSRDHVHDILIFNCKTIVSAIQKHRNDRTAQLDAFRAFTNLTYRSSTALLFDWLDEIVEVMQSFADSDDTELLLAYGRFYSGLSDEMGYCCFSKGNCLQMILQMMRRHLGKVEVIDLLLYVLHNCTAVVVDKAAMIASEGVGVTLSAMNAHILSADIQLYGCVALANVGLDSVGEDQIMQSGGFEVIVAAMTSFDRNCDIQMQGLRAFHVMARRKEDCRQRMRTSGVLEITKQSFQKYREGCDNDSKLKTQLSESILGNLCASPDEYM